MWEHMWVLDVPFLALVLRAVLVFLGIVLLLRLSGKRQVGQLDATEFVMILLVGESVQNALIAGDTSLSGGMVLAATVVGTSVLISILTFRSPLLRRFLEGKPTVLMRGGKVIRRNLRYERISNSDFKALLRKNGVHDFSNVEEVILEADGGLSVTKKGEEPFEFEESEEEEPG